MKHTRRSFLKVAGAAGAVAAAGGVTPASAAAPSTSAGPRGLARGLTLLTLRRNGSNTSASRPSAASST